MALSDTCKEAIFLQSFLNEIYVIANKTIYSTIIWKLKNWRKILFITFDRSTLTIDIILLGTVQIILVHVSSDEMIPDILTKILSKAKHDACKSQSETTICTALSLVIGCSIYFKKEQKKFFCRKFTLTHIILKTEETANILLFLGPCATCVGLSK